MGADLRKVHRVIHAGCPSSSWTLCRIKNIYFHFTSEYVQQAGRAGRDGLKAEAIIFYNNNDLSSKLLEKDMKRYLTLENGCRRYAFCMKQIAGQKQIDRYLVHMALKEYVKADVSGEIAFHLHDDLLKRITETFDIIPMDINEIVRYYNIPRYIADSLNAILVTFRK
ncbi:hypothetical protein ACJMK2_002110 [Sinanodonta woodiana]|uniref:Helicase C-terminal domain-containing protein n=1 Tax=Sinanodonta woodiana TaxID=1069815 RepID=A0ABD3XUU9_SINWO